MRRAGWILLLLGIAAAVAALALKAVRPGEKGEAMLSPGDAIELGAGTLVVKSFEVPKYPDGRPRQFVTGFHIIDRLADEVVHGETRVNHPFRWHDLWIHQSGYDRVAESFTVLAFSMDPYLPVAAAGGLLLLLGSLLLALSPRHAPDPLPPSRSACRRPPSPVLRRVAFLLVLAVPLVIIARAVFRPEPVPALQSPLMAPHVAAYAASYIVMIAAAFGFLKRMMPTGFFLMTAGLVLGAVWGKLCWGDWWQYDPKEMWGAATWAVYLVYFALAPRVPVPVERFLRLAGAAMVLATATWVNFSRLFAGLHNYAGNAFG